METICKTDWSLVRAALTWPRVTAAIERHTSTMLGPSWAENGLVVPGLEGFVVSRRKEHCTLALLIERSFEIVVWMRHAARVH